MIDTRTEYRYYVDLGERINAVDFDHPFSIVDGAIVDVPGEYAPEVYHDETNDVDMCGYPWTCLTGMTGQYGYNGAVMHPSEFIGAGIARYLVEDFDAGTVFAIVTVTDLDADRDAGEDDAAGWAIAVRNAR